MRHVMNIPHVKVQTVIVAGKPANDAVDAPCPGAD